MPKPLTFAINAPTDYSTGTCGICHRSFKATDGSLSRHGYSAPSWRSQTRSCAGSNRHPIEVSDSTLRAGLLRATNEAKWCRKQSELRDLPAHTAARYANAADQHDKAAVFFTAAIAEYAAANAPAAPKTRAEKLVALAAKFSNVIPRAALLDAGFPMTAAKYPCYWSPASVGFKVATAAGLTVRLRKAGLCVVA